MAAETVDPIVGYTDLAEDASGQMWGTAHRASGKSERTTVRITVEREHRRADGELVASGVVADSDLRPGSVRV